MGTYTQSKGGFKTNFSLDYSIVRDTDRVTAVRDILDTLDADPSQAELELMASYILYGKNDEGQNLDQQHLTTKNSTRYNSFRLKEDTNESLDAILDNPGPRQNEFQPLHRRSPYLQKKTTIRRPKLDKKTGAVLDPGDSDIPGMEDYWEIIDRWEHRIGVMEGKIAPTEDDTGIRELDPDSYSLYQLKHILIDIRRHQYYLKDHYKPTIYWAGADRPRAQYYDFTADSFYWISYEEWEQRVRNSLLRSTSRDLNDYETRLAPDGSLQVKWLVKQHTFDWENPKHIRALINIYDLLYDAMHDKFESYSYTLFIDLERYRRLANLTPLQNFILDMRLRHIQYTAIHEACQQKFGRTINVNHISTVLSKIIPERIAAAALRQRLLTEVPAELRKICPRCKRLLPKSQIFFFRSSISPTGFATICKNCDREKRYGHS